MSEDKAHPSTSNSKTRTLIKRSSSLKSPTEFPGLFELEHATNGQTSTRFKQMGNYNLHSVINKAKTTWTESLYDAFYNPPEPDAPILPSEHIEKIESGDLRPFLSDFGKAIDTYTRDHAYTIDDQLTSSNVPSIKAADADVKKCYESVPALFFQPDFDLTNPQIFQDMLLGDSEEMGEALARHLDRVEMSLLKQVSSRSENFYQACATQEDLTVNVNEACQEVKELRATMTRLNTVLADKTLRVSQLRRREARAERLQDTLLMIKEVSHAEASTLALIQANDFTGALNVISQAKEYLEGDLKGVQCIASLKSKLDKCTKRITSDLTTQFTSTIASSGWEFHYDEPQEETQNKKQVLAQQLVPLLDGLLRTDATEEILEKYHRHVVDEVKSVVKTVVNDAIESSEKGLSEDQDTAAESQPQNFKAQLQSLNSEEFLLCLEMIFEHLLMVLHRCTIVDAILVDRVHAKSNLSTAEEGSPRELDPAAQRVVAASDEVVRKACEFAQRSISNLFGVRKVVQASYSMEQLHVLYDQTFEFITRMEAITSKKYYPLRTALFDQMKLFLETYHNTYMSKLVSTLDNELWKIAEVSYERQTTLSDLVAAKDLTGAKASGQTGRATKSVRLEGKAYRVVWSALFTMEIIVNYLICASNFPILGTDVLQRIMEILRLFNSRTTQLVLGAGAMQVARLKSISARHLALASQSLEMIASCFPHIREVLAKFIPKQQQVLLVELERIAQDYDEHVHKIFHKLISIVEDQIMNKCLSNGKLEQIQYDSSSQKIPSSPMQFIASSTAKLHGVLRPVLPPEQLQSLYTKIFAMFTKELPGHFAVVTPETPAGKQRVVDEIGQFLETLANLPDVEFQDETLRRHFETTYGPCDSER